jgi:sulfide:quinone oxidoreductase
MQLHKLNEDLYISDQIELADIPLLKAIGIKTIVNNRPDGETVAQPNSQDISVAAQKLGIDYDYLPITPGCYPASLIDKFLTLLTIKKRPMVAFCRTGNRSVSLWALSQSQKYGRDYVVAKAKSIGYDI